MSVDGYAYWCGRLSALVRVLLDPQQTVGDIDYAQRSIGEYEEWLRLNEGAGL